MGINTPSEIEAELSVGPTDRAMVRIFVTTGEIEIPMDFTFSFTFIQTFV